MKRFLRVTSIALGTVIVLAGTGLSYLAFGVPPNNPLPLPDTLIAADSSRGKELLADRAYTADYELLSQTFEPQIRRAYCGVASSVMALNALRAAEPRLTQATFFTDSASRVRSPLQVTFAGMSLAQLSDLLRAHGANVATVYASDTTPDAFRDMAKDNLRKSTDYLLVNYQRAVLGQGETGHISPVAAYNLAADRLLVLDVASYKYPPVWVSVEALWNAMNTIDSASGRTRGFVMVSGVQQAVPGELRRYTLTTR